jgi:hypothetical protein
MCKELGTTDCLDQEQIEHQVITHDFLLRHYAEVEVRGTIYYPNCIMRRGVAFETR